MATCRDCGIRFVELIKYDPEDPDSVARMTQLEQLVGKHRCPVKGCSIRVVHTLIEGGVVVVRMRVHA